MPRNYQNARIYRLVSASGRQYIGSTTELLCRRIAGHRGQYQRWKQGGFHFVSSFHLFDEEGKVEIFLVENYPCENHEELLRRERYWIETTDCVNKIIPTRTKKEYNEANKDKISERKKKHYQTIKQKISEQQKLYREANKDKISEQQKLYREANKDKISEQQKEHYQTNKDKISERMKQHYQTNKDKISEQQKQHYQTNKDKISERKKQKIQCECGAEIRRNDLARHHRSKKHLKWVEDQQQQD